MVLATLPYIIPNTTIKGKGTQICNIENSSRAKTHVILTRKLDRNLLNFSHIFSLNVNFENLIVELYVYYVYNLHVKSHSNRILFIIQSINFFYAKF